MQLKVSFQVSHPLPTTKIPTQLLIIVEKLFNASFTCVQLNILLFRLVASVRQGGVLSPLFLALLIDSIVDRVKNLMYIDAME